jgi:hypothetical protein
MTAQPPYVSCRCNGISFLLFAPLLCCKNNGPRRHPGLVGSTVFCPPGRATSCASLPALSRTQRQKKSRVGRSRDRRRNRWSSTWHPSPVESPITPHPIPSIPIRENRNSAHGVPGEAQISMDRSSREAVLLSSFRDRLCIATPSRDALLSKGKQSINFH